MKSPIQKKRRPRRPLQGEALTKIALHEISDYGSWQRGTKLNWVNLAARIRVSTRALFKRPEVVDAYHKAKEELAKPQATAKAILRRDSNQQIAVLRAANLELQASLDAYVEKWAEIERNCRALNIEPDQVFGSGESGKK